MSTLRRFHNGIDSEDFIRCEYQEIFDQIIVEKESLKPTWTQILKKPSWRRRVFLSIGLQIFSQLTGINCVQYYAASIYQRLGFGTKDALMLNLIYGGMGFVFGILWVSTIDRFRRAMLLVFAEGFMCVALLVQAILSALYAGKMGIGTNALNAQVAMLFVFNLFFIAVRMLSWLMPPEMCPMAIHANTNSISVSVGLVIAEVSPIVLAQIGFKFFFVFVACDIVAALTYYFIYPETSKLTLEQMDVLFGDQIVQHVLADNIPTTGRGTRKTSVGGRGTSSIEDEIVANGRFAHADSKEAGELRSDVDHRENV